MCDLNPTAPAKYKCPRCRTPYCSVPCSRLHKSICTVLPPPPPSTKRTFGTFEPDSTVLSRAKKFREDDNDIILTTSLMSQIDTSSYLKEKLKSSGLRSLLLQIETSPNRAETLKHVKNGSKYGEQFRVFIDEMLIDLKLAGIEEGRVVWKVFYKPKRMDAGYKRFLCFHFFSGPVLSEVEAIVGHFRKGLTIYGWLALCKIPIWCFTLWLGLKLRESVAKLPRQELSDFLCQAVLVKCTAAMGTMLFFSFEIVSCFISQGSLDSEMCVNTSNAALCLSLYLAILTVLSGANKTAPKSVQRDLAWELSSIASLKGLKWWHQIQGGLMIIMAISSLYLLSVLGVEGNENSMVEIVGWMGTISIGFAFLINATMLVRTRNEHQRNTTTVELPPTQRSARGFSASDIEENTIAFALV
ncbi:hypothetical protein TrVE_jg13375 [Triparma verrucosa]|uniref:HIT-type domain-containing protein n=1 Tax=Triparma verrucosa TaxID=1606542 RepID=A0A9W7F876_9STRA|nr:hypothetical protein TrVE_jg13375 [Triparma verrucosa]